MELGAIGLEIVSGEDDVDTLVVTTRATFGRATLGMWCGSLCAILASL